VTLSGAIVDVGAPVDGLLHISDLGDKRVTRTSDILSEGQMITTWVKRVDLQGGRLSLTMVEPPKYTWKDLAPGTKVQGKVVRLERFGAFVDIGAGTDGLVHVSEMGTGRVANPSDVVSEGDVIEVWIKDVDRKSKRISLSMVERLESFGAFVDIGAGRDGMIHVTEMGRGYVGSPSEIVSVGDQVQVRVLEVDPRRGRISLSMKDLPADDYVVDDEMEELPTAMELALREAMEIQGVDLPMKPDTRSRKKKSKRQYDRVQDEIISRTLRSRRD
jgi:ribosomal protein S1